MDCSKKLRSSPKKNEKQKLISDLVTRKNTQNDSVNNTTDQEVPSKAQKTIDIATAVVQINKRITTKLTLETRHSNGVSNLSVAQAHRNIFMTLKLIEAAVKLFTPGNVTIYLLDDFPSDASKYTSIFNDVTKYSKSS